MNNGSQKILPCPYCLRSTIRSQVHFCLACGRKLPYRYRQRLKSAQQLLIQFLSENPSKEFETKKLADILDIDFHFLHSILQRVNGCLLVTKNSPQTLKFPLSPCGLRVLKALDSPLPIYEAAKAAQVGRSTASHALRMMLEQGFVKRKPSLVDSRTYDYFRTEKGNLLAKVKLIDYGRSSQ